MVLYLLNNVEGYKNDSRFEDLRLGKVKLFSAGDKYLKAIYKQFKFLGTKP